MFIIYGCGGHGRSIADVLVDNGEEDIVFVDENAKDGEKIMGIPVMKSMPEKFAAGDKVILAIGDNDKRKHVATENPDWPYSSVVAHDAYVSRFAEIGLGTFVAHGAYVGPRSRIGQQVIINTHAVVEHDCEIGEFSHVAPGAVALGGVRMGSKIFLGGGTVTRNNVMIADNITVGAGSVVVKNIREGGTYVGMPAVLLKR